MDRVRRWLEQAPYAERLGVRVDALTAESARLRLPFREENSNPGGVLHGGVAASLVALGGQAVGRLALDGDGAPWHTAAVQVSYLAAAREEAVIAEATRLRAGKEVCFTEVRVQTESGRAVACGQTVTHARSGAAPAQLAAHATDGGAGEPGPMAPHVEQVSFMRRLGLRVEHMQGGRSRIRLPLRDENRDEGGGMHEGAALALLDTTGGMAAWAQTGPGAFKASTPALQGRILAPLPAEALVGFGRVVQHDAPLFWVEVELVAADSGHVVARGTILYRIVVRAPEGGAGEPAGSLEGRGPSPSG